MPQQIVVSEKIVRIGSGNCFSYYLGESGACYAAYSERSITLPSRAVPENPYLRQIDFPEPVVLAGGGYQELYLLTEGGTLYATGKSDYSAFAEKDAACPSGFEKLPFSEKVVRIGDTRSLFTLLLTESGGLYALCPKTGNCFLLSDRYLEESCPLTAPEQITAPDAMTDCNCTGLAVFYRRADGKVFFFGTGGFGNGLSVKLPVSSVLMAGFVLEPVEVKLHFSENCRFD